MTETPEVPDLPLLTAPADGLPALVVTREQLEHAMLALGSGTGPVAVDTERAQGFRYSGSAYLVQLRRAGAGTVLIDPVPFGTPADLGRLGAALAGPEWIIHAASQDLPCLREAGMVPTRVFDTELAGRLLSYPRVGLGPLLEQTLGVRLLKEHSAADWSSRPLPTDWLNYAALDVELLIPLRDVLADELVAQGKDEWARQEFAAIAEAAALPPVPRVDPWRRTSGLHALRLPAQLALVRELWEERDAIARREDRGPSRILIDLAITELAALVDPAARHWPTREELRDIDGFKRRTARRFEANWLDAIERSRQLSRADLPPRHLPLDGPPAQPRSWESHHPDEYARWLKVRPPVNARAEELAVPAENLLAPAVLRDLAWRPPPEVDEGAVHEALLGYGARPWQADATAGPIAEALAD